MSEGIRIAVAIVERSNQVLMVQRTHREGTLNWQFPAGKLEADEEATNAAEREVFEETGVRCRALHLLGTRRNAQNGVFIYYVLCDYVGGKEFLKDARENKDIRWVRVTDLRAFVPENLFEGIAIYFGI